MQQQFRRILNYLFFILLFPGSVAGWIPVLIISNYPHELEIGYWNLIAIPVWLAGALFFITSILMFFYHSGGTPTTKLLHGISLLIGRESNRLVASGIYRFSRNPMYTGVLLIVLGTAVFNANIMLGYYLVGLILVFNLFIRFYEEPTLRSKHGSAYDEYCKRVPRWL